MSRIRRAFAVIAPPPPCAPIARCSRARHVAALAGLLACTSLSVQAGDCTITTTPINFGVYDPITNSAPVDSTGTVRLQCSATDFGELLGGVNVSIALSQGSSGTYAARTLRQPPSSVLQYNLYTTAARNTVWGNGSGGTSTAGGAVGGLFSGQPNPRSFTIFGRIPAGQDPNLGLHSDTITVTVVF
ncbi:MULTISPECIES: Csu type fimbrial protein [unclassified Luteimonas]